MKLKNSLEMRKKGRFGVKRIVAGCMALILVTGGLTVHRKLPSGKETTDMKIMSSTVQRGDVTTSISGSGTIEGVLASAIRIPEGIMINEIFVAEGDSMKKGTRIASVDKATVAEVLLTVRDAIDDLEDAIDDLDDDDLDDTESDDYLKKLSYDGQLSDLNDIEDTLEKMLDSGYITSSKAGIIGSLFISEGEETGTESDSDTNSTSSKTSSSVNVTSALVNATSSTSSSVKTTYGEVAQVTRFASSSITVNDVQKSEEDSTEISSNSKKETGDASSDESKNTDKDTNTGNETKSDDTSSTNDDNSSDTNTEGTAADDKTSSDSNDHSTSGQEKSQNNNNTKNQKDKNTKNMNKTGGSPSMGGGGSKTSSLTSTSSSDSTETIGDITLVKVAKLHSKKQVVVNVSVDEADIESVKTGQTASVTLTALPDKTFEGSVSAISGADSESGGSVKYNVEILLDKEEGMREGMSASTVINIEEAADTLLIPSAAIQEKGDSAFVYTTKDDDGTLSGEKEITVGLSDGSNVQIKEGLEEGETVYYSISKADDSGNRDETRRDEFEGGDGMPGGGAPPSGGFGRPGGN